MPAPTLKAVLSRLISNLEFSQVLDREIVTERAATLLKRGSTPRKLATAGGWVLSLARKPREAED
jgi:hypothetical protein